MSASNSSNALVSSSNASSKLSRSLPKSSTWEALTPSVCLALILNLPAVDTRRLANLLPASAPSLANNENATEALSIIILNWPNLLVFLTISTISGPNFSVSRSIVALFIPKLSVSVTY